MIDFKKNNDINIIVDYIKKDEEFGIDTNVSVFTQYLDDLLEEGYSQDDVSNYILTIKHLEEKKSQKYTKFINKLANATEEERQETSFFLAHMIFQTESIRVYEGLFIDKLMKEQLSTELYHLCVKAMIDEKLSFIKKTSAFDSTPDYGDNRTYAFNQSIQFHVENIFRSPFNDKMMDSFLVFVKEDLKGKTFLFKEKEHLFEDICIDFVKNKPIINIDCFLDDEKKTVPLSKIIWRFD